MTVDKNPEAVEPDDPRESDTLDPEPTPDPENAPDGAKGDGDGDTLDPKQQAALERRIERELRKQQLRYDAEVKAEKERLRKEAREAKLLEDKNFEKLAQEREQELNELREANGKRELNEKTDTLLDRAEITQPELRALVKELPGDLEARQQHIDGIMAVIDAQVEAKVADRLRTPRPTKDTGRPGSKSLKNMTPGERNEARKKMGDEKYADAWRRENAAS